MNLTPHEVRLITEDGTAAVLPSPPRPARLCEQREEVGHVETEVGTIRVTEVALGEALDLPPSRPGTWYVVSRTVAEATPRRDLVYPDALVRDSEGRVVAAGALARLGSLAIEAR